MTIPEIAKNLRRQFSRNLREDEELTPEERTEMKRVHRTFTDIEVIDDWLECAFCPCRKPLFIATSLAGQAKTFQDWLDLLAIKAENN